MMKLLISWTSKTKSTHLDFSTEGPSTSLDEAVSNAISLPTDSFASPKISLTLTTTSLSWSRVGSCANERKKNSILERKNESKTEDEARTFRHCYTCNSLYSLLTSSSSTFLFRSFDFRWIVWCASTSIHRFEVPFFCFHFYL